MEVEDGGGAAAADSSRNTASPGLFDLVRSLWSPTPATPSENGNSSSARLAPPKAPVLIASSPIRKRRRSAVDEGTEVDDDSAETLSPKQRAKRPATDTYRRSIDSVTSVTSGVGSLLGTIFSPVYDLLVGGSAVTRPPVPASAASSSESGGQHDCATAAPSDPDQEDTEDEDMHAFDSWDFIRSIPPLEEIDGGKWLKRKPVLPPRRKADKSKPLTLVLDLDETLVHCEVNEMTNYDYVFPVHLDKRKYTVYARRRPFMKQFLERVSELFEVVLFTASQQVYADELLDLFDADRKLIHYRLFRGDCVEVEGNYVKDLHILGRDLAKTMIVDNSVQAFAYQVDNGIHIKTWRDDANDMELMKLLPFLEKLAKDNVADVRPVLEKKFGLVSRI
eukprot:m.52452 g.52452  ORF g.52452 m.52452 type:complete len:392 (+) comp9102_c0_seq2:62-1237(+)